MLDAEFESVQLNMTPDEAKEHMMKLIYHMLGTAYEIKILSNARIVEHIEDETTQIEKKKDYWQKRCLIISTNCYLMIR